MKYQVTFFDKEGHHKPVATVINANSRHEIALGLWKDAAKKICIKRGWTYQDLKKYGYTIWKCRLVE